MSWPKGNMSKRCLCVLQEEPVVLPAALPNLLLNGSAGIAVAIATKIPPHNMCEVVDALRALIKNPAISTAELMQHVPAPDFPTGLSLFLRSDVRIISLTSTGLPSFLCCDKCQE